MHGDTYIGNTQQTFKNILDGHFSDVQPILKNAQKLETFAAHFEHHFKFVMSHMNLCKYMTFK